jgi:hypothetical protein
LKNGRKIEMSKRKKKLKIKRDKSSYRSLNYLTNLRMKEDRRKSRLKNSNIEKKWKSKKKNK